MGDETFIGRPVLNVTRTARPTNLAGPGGCCNLNGRKETDD
jgi:hypothetical protein